MSSRQQSSSGAQGAAEPAADPTPNISYGRPADSSLGLLQKTDYDRYSTSDMYRTAGMMAGQGLTGSLLHLLFVTASSDGNLAVGLQYVMKCSGGYCSEFGTVVAIHIHVYVM